MGELQATVQRLLALGATLDGPIKYSARGKARPALLSLNSSAPVPRARLTLVECSVSDWQHSTI